MDPTDPDPQHWLGLRINSSCFEKHERLTVCCVGEGEHISAGAGALQEQEAGEHGAHRQPQPVQPDQHIESGTRIHIHKTRIRKM
jgi:hypothetical protein